MCSTARGLTSLTTLAAEIRAQTRSTAADTDAESISSLRMLLTTLSSSSFSLLLFMMFLQIVPYLFSKSGFCAMKYNAYNKRRRVHCFGDFTIIKPLVITH